jgi:hypothetical protein
MRFILEQRDSVVVMHSLKKTVLRFGRNSKKENKK